MSTLARRSRKREKDPTEFKPLIPLSIAGGLLILAAVFLFVTPIGKTFTKKAVQQISITIEQPKPVVRPTLRPQTVSPRGDSSFARPDSVEKPTERKMSAPTAPEKSGSVFDRILASVDKFVGSAMGLIAMLTALRVYTQGKKAKKARAAKS